MKTINPPPKQKEPVYLGPVIDVYGIIKLEYFMAEAAKMMKIHENTLIEGGMSKEDAESMYKDYLICASDFRKLFSNLRKGNLELITRPRK